MGQDTSAIACCFDAESKRMLEDYREARLSDTSELILSSLSSRGLAGSTVLELGSGVGGLCIEAVKMGASSAKGLDLSPRMVAAAKALASQEGVLSVEFEVGDGAAAPLPPSDMVVLDAVLCCYPDVDALVANTSAAARKYYAISLPDDRHLLIRFAKALLPLQKVFFRRGSFRFFVHPVRRVIAQLQASGFSVVSDVRCGRVWSVIVFATIARR